MIRQLALVLWIALLSLGAANPASAAHYELVNGTALDGDPIAFDGRGVVIKRLDGTYADRAAWTNFTQSALKLLAQNPKIKQFVDPLIEEEDEEKDAPKPPPKELQLKEVPRLNRPDPRAGFGAVFASSVTLTTFFLIYLANVYAGYVIARYRNYPPALVCGLAAVAPIVVPIIFLSLPNRPAAMVEEAAAAYSASSEPIPVPEAPPAMPDPGGEDTARAAAPAPTGGPPPPIIFRRPAVTFNRRFFETKLAGFLRVVPSEAEKDLLVCVVSARGNYVGQRITRVLTSDLFLQVKKGDAFTDVVIPFSEINEVQIRHMNLPAPG